MFNKTWLMFNKTSMLFLIFFLVCLVPAFAVQSVTQVTQISSGDTGLTIEYPKYSNVPQYSNFTLHTHIYNQTNGMPVYQTPSCYLHLYSTNSEHTIKEEMKKSSDGIDYEIFIANGNFTDIGSHAYIIWCNISSVGLGGFASGIFDVVNETTTDVPTSEQTSIYVTSIFIFTIMFLVSLFSAIFTNGKNKYTMGKVDINYGKYLKIGLFFLSYFSAWILTFFSQLIVELYFDLTFISNFLFFIFQTMSILIIPVILVTGSVVIADWIADIKLLKEQKRNLPPR